MIQNKSQPRLNHENKLGQIVYAEEKHSQFQFGVWKLFHYLVLFDFYPNYLFIVSQRVGQVCLLEH